MSEYILSQDCVGSLKLVCVRQCLIAVRCVHVYHREKRTENANSWNMSTK